MQFPKIEHIDDIRPHIKDLPHIKEYERPGHLVLNYTFADYSLFPNAHSLECRGIKFNSNTGRIIARPFHKFFNLHEGGVTHDPSQPHRVYHKLDGSMIHYALRSDHAFLPMTKMGYTDVAKQVEAWTPIYLLDRILEFDCYGTTLLFEWTSPHNRVVLSYPTPQLTLLAARNIITGEYKGHEELERIASYLDCPLVDIFNDHLDTVKTLDGKEGVVIVYDTGHRLKLKADEYVRIHKIKDNLVFEKNVLQAVLDNKIDDWVAILPPDDRVALRKYSLEILSWRSTIEVLVEWFYDGHKHLSRKDYAAEAMKLNTFMRGLCFAKLDGKDPDYVVSALRKIAVSGTKIEALAVDHPIFPRWKQEIPND